MIFSRACAVLALVAVSASPSAAATAGGNSVFIEQITGRNTATVGQTRAADSTVRVTQSGDGNRSTVVQSGARTTAQIAQYGDDNTSALEQSTLNGAALHLAQSGNNNTATARQGGGAANVAYLVQTGVGNSMHLEQSGSDNAARLTQNGDNNAMTASQSGVGNYLAWRQEGSDLSNLGISQTGASRIGIIQSWGVDDDGATVMVLGGHP